MMMTYATVEGTKKYAEKFKDLKNNYRDFMGLQISSIGLGTYLGLPNDADDRLYEEAVQTALLSGCNLLDSAINYRCMRSERAIGKAIKTLIDSGKITREEIVVCTKGGFIPFDGGTPPNPAQYFHDEYISPGLCAPSDIAAGCHCMTPAYLRNQVERSLKNLGLETIDLFYVHNPETQLEEVSKEEFYTRLEKAFAELEKLVDEGKIRAYGTATWNGYRVPPEARDHLSLADVIKAAQKAGGNDHHFKAIQLPYNMGMAEAWGMPTQVFGSQTIPALEAAKANNLAVFTSASILQARLAKNLPAVIAETFPGFETDAQRAIQFTRSTPGVTAALVGMKRKEHVEENLKVAAITPAGEEKIKFLFSDK
jgi:aryl-alcohol dehydrogenase-like predicted oxidoreductase